MPLPSSGKITTQTFRDFFEISSSTPISSSDWYRGGPYVKANYQSVNGNVSINNQVPTSGRITLSDLYGAYKVVPANNIAPGNTTNYPTEYPNSPDEPAPISNDGDVNIAEDPYTNTSNVGNGPMNAPTNDYGAGPSGAYQDAFPNSPDGGTAGNTNPPTGNADYTQHFGNNTDVTSGGDPPPPIGNGSDATTKNGFWVYADTKPPGTTNPPNNDYGAGPSGIYEDAFVNNSDGGTVGYQNSPDLGGVPGTEDPVENVTDVTTPSPTSNPPSWIDHEKIV